MPKTCLAILFCLALAALNPAAAGEDVVILNDGSEVRGRILGVGGAEVVMEARFSETIFEERRIPRADVREIRRHAPDLAVFAALQKEAVPPTALSPEAYDTPISRLEGFLNVYPYSQKVPEVRQRLSTLELERQRVVDGEIKLDGVWLPQSQIERNRYELDALRVAAAMERAAAEADLVRALNQFAQLEKNWPGSSVLPSALRQTLGYLDQLDRLLEHELRNYRILAREREDLVALADPQDQRRIQQAREREIDQMKSAIERAKATGEKFPPYFPVYPDSMEDLRKTLSAERNRLSKMDLTGMESSTSQSSRARSLLAQKEYPAAREAVEAALRAWPANEAAKTLQEEIAAAEELARQRAEAAQGAPGGTGFTEIPAEAGGDPAQTPAP